MRLIAIPLARVRPGAPPVTTFLAQATKAARPTNAAATATSAQNGIGVSDTSVSSSLEKGKNPVKGSNDTGLGGVEDDKNKKLPLVTRVMNKAADFWVGLGREDQKSTLDWKRRTYNLGEKMMDRIEYEEWALKGVDPTIGPSVKPIKMKQEGKEINKEDQGSTTAVNVSSRFSTQCTSASLTLGSFP